MPKPRHTGRHVAPRGRSLGRRPRRLSAPVTALALLAGGGVALAVTPLVSPSTIEGAARLPQPRDPGTADLSSRQPEVQVSRSADRSVGIVPPGRSGVETAPVPKPTGYQWTTAVLNVWSGPGEDTQLVSDIPEAARVAVTGIEEGGWAEIIRAGMPRWVNAGYLSPDKPTATTATIPGAPGPPGAISYAACPLGKAVESGLTPDAVRVYRAVCAAFPQITSYGGLRPGDSGEHGTGRALDIMTSDEVLGDEIAAWLIDHRTELGVSELLWRQQIWTVERISDGWRTLPDRGSDTANHDDHVHVTVYGDSGRG